MKRLLILTAIAMISAGTLGCCGSGRSWCNRGTTTCPTPCPTTGGCNTCGDGATYGDSYMGAGAVVMPGPVTN